jgi:transposase-like protein
MTTTTTMTAGGGSEAGTVIKMDRMGRMRFSRAQREKILGAFEASGMNGTAFAALHGVKYQTLATWLQKQRRERGAYPEGKAVPPALAQFVEVEMSEESPVADEPPVAGASPLVLKFPGGARLVLTTADQAPMAAALLKELTREDDAEL